MPRTAKPEALITTPADSSWCLSCDVAGTRYAGDAEGRFFPHCPECGYAELVDLRSPYVVLAEAIANADAPGLDPVVRMGRRDVVDRVRFYATVADPEHCSECIVAARRLRPSDLQIAR